MRLFSNVWSENTALFERLMEIHFNSPKLYYGFKHDIYKYCSLYNMHLITTMCCVVMWGQFLFFHKIKSPHFSVYVVRGHYSLNKKEWICLLFKEWILEKSEIRVNLEWIWSEHLCYSLILEWPQGSLGDSEWSLRSLQNEWITQMFTPNSL